MIDIEAYSRLQWIDGLIGYLDVRQWAFEKIQSTPVGSNLIDLRMHHYLYFTSLFGAIDLVRDCLPTDQKQAFEGHLQQGFAKPGDYPYARELRNSIVHRGLDPAMNGVQMGDVILVGCPPVVHSQGGKKSYACSFPLLVHLAAACNRASNAAIFAALERDGFFDAVPAAPNKAEVLATLEAAPDVPGWVVSMATEAFDVEDPLDRVDFDAMMASITQSQIQQLRSLLGYA